MADRKKTIFFFISSKHEFFEFTKILKKINLKNQKLYLLIENSERNQNIEFNFNSNINIIFLPNIYPSKNLLKNILLKKEIIKILKNLNFCKDDLFIYFHNGSLLFFIVYLFFNKYNLKKIMFVTSNFVVPNDNSKISFKETFLLNILSYPLLNIIVYKKYFVGTVFKNTYIKQKIDYVICLKNEISFTKTKTFNIESYFVKQNKTHVNEPKYLILVVSYWINKFSSYKDTVKFLISKHGKKNVLIKDHPLSNLNDIDLINIFSIDKENIIPKQISLENYIENNQNNFKLIYGPTSAALKYASFMGLDVICYQNLFSNNLAYNKHTLEYFKFHGKVKIISKLSNNTFTYENRKIFHSVEHKLEEVFHKIL